MTYYSGNLYIVQGGYLNKVNPNTGTYTALGSAVWGGSPTSMAVVGTHIYIQQGASIWRIDSTLTGAYSTVGTGDWSGTILMTSLNGALFPIQSAAIARASVVTGGWTQLGHADWGNTSAITALP